MGMFSWYRADNTTRQTNLVQGDTFKILIPQEFGGGFIKGKYGGYGDCITKEGIEYDVYELLAFWNEMDLKGRFNMDLRFDGERPLVPSHSGYTQHNRSYGIDVGCYDAQQARLKYPLKLVSASYKGTYEDCGDFSRMDGDQGFWRKYDRVDH